MNLFNPDLYDVDPVRPPAAWIGGKKQLSARICAMIDEIPHKTYAEPFCGMGGVFFRRRRRPKSEVINDINQDVANLFRILQRHYQAFIDELKFSLTGRATYERLLKTRPENLTDLERAARFLYLQRLAFGGKVRGRSFGVDKMSPARFNLTTLEPLLAEVHERLAGVVIERLDWGAFLDSYDHPDALFYLDPPYWGSESDYGKGVFTRSQFALMAARLEVIEGAFILSLNDTPDVRETFKVFAIEAVSLSYTVQGGEGVEAKEVLIMNERARAAQLG